MQVHKESGICKSKVFKTEKPTAQKKLSRLQFPNVLRWVLLHNFTEDSEAGN